MKINRVLTGSLIVSLLLVGVSVFALSVFRHTSENWDDGFRTNSPVVAANFAQRSLDCRSP